MVDSQKRESVAMWYRKQVVFTGKRKNFTYIIRYRRYRYYNRTIRSSISEMIHIKQYKKNYPLILFHQWLQLMAPCSLVVYYYEARATNQSSEACQSHCKIQESLVVKSVGSQVSADKYLLRLKLFAPALLHFRVC